MPNFIFCLLFFIAYKGKYYYLNCEEISLKNGFLRHKKPNTARENIINFRLFTVA